MDLQSLENNQVISDYIYNNRESIPIVNVVKVTDDVWGRLDVIIFEYCDGMMELLPIIMDFNKITNPFNLPIGMYINIPDYQYILEQIDVINLETIPGVNNSMSCTTTNENNMKSGLNKSEKQTVAIPKLNISLKKVSYDSTTGIITY